MATGLNRLGAAAYTNTPPAIVEQAKDWRYYEQAILSSEDNTGKLYREYKEGGAWKAHYKTWEAACAPLGKSRSQVDRLIKEIVIISDNRAKCAESTDTQDKKEQKALSQVEQAREEEPESEEKPEEPEKPAVHSADEVKRDECKPQNNGHAKPTESGKPKYALAIWRELEETLYGRAMNRVDELNRQCPGTLFHKQLIAATKNCLDILENWKASVK